MARLQQVTIVGLGLIGGSLGMVLRRRRLARRVVGLSRTASTIRRANARGAIDRGTTNPVRAVRDADLVVLAGPVDSIIPQARRLARVMRPGAMLTDVGSTKRRIVAGLEGKLPRQIAFVGAHPLAGSEQRGIDAARADLFDGAACIVTATPRTNRRALQQVVRFWKPLVRRVVVMDPARHDRWLAAVSHLPHLIAFCLIGSAEGGARALAPRSFLDATRMAMSDPDLWDDILFTNREAVLAAMSRFERRWTAARRLLERRHQRSLQRFLRDAQRLRRLLQDP